MFSDFIIIYDLLCSRTNQFLLLLWVFPLSCMNQFFTRKMVSLGTKILGKKSQGLFSLENSTLSNYDSLQMAVFLLFSCSMSVMALGFTLVRFRLIY
jgi:hypothetical protein